MHRIDQANPFLDAALADKLLNRVRDVHKAQAVGNFEP